MLDATPREKQSIDEVVEAFESAQRGGEPVDLRRFLPDRDAADYLSVLCELIRVDLEYGWDRGRPKRLAEYRREFPELFRDGARVEEIAFEEFRLRKQAGENPTLAEYRRDFGTRAADWPESLIGSPAGRDSAEIETPVGSVRHLKAHLGLDQALDAYRRLRPTRSDRFDLERALRTEGVPDEPARFLSELHETNPILAERWTVGIASLPEVGGRFHGFELREELGRGAFGRVYLARQGELADRLVALKISADVSDESRALAQLQHTNVVPIHSIHRSGSLQAVCMPYLGSTTLADVLKEIKKQESLPATGAGLLSSRKDSESKRGSATVDARGADSTEPAVPSPLSFEQAALRIQRLKGLGYVEAVLWIGSRLADGLSHAHERGILHRDLKPANVLFADDGEPMLLDFGLATDTKLRGNPSAALIGGTLPYMAPEHLAAFRGRDEQPDARGDIYSLGVILHELLTGRLPHPIRTGKTDEYLSLMIEDRTRPIPSPRLLNPRITPAVESILRKALDPCPDRRFRTAGELRDDLRRQLENLPLRHAPEPSIAERVAKWRRRHPRLGSTAATLLFAAAILAATIAGFSVHIKRLRAVEARSTLVSLEDTLENAAAILSGGDAEPGRLEEGISLCRTALTKYGLPDNPDWARSPLATTLDETERSRLGDDLGGLLHLWSGATLKRTESAVGRERDDLLREATRLSDLSRPMLQPGAWLRRRAEIERRYGRLDQAEGLEKQANALGPPTPRELLLSDSDRADPESVRRVWSFVWRDSVQNAENPSVWLRLGNLYAQLGLRTKKRSYLEEAELCYATSIDLRPDGYWAYFNRGLLRLDMGNPKGAAEDFDQVLRLRPELRPALINRAIARIGSGDASGAEADLTRVLESKTPPTRAWFLRARARVLARNPSGAAEDRAEGLKRTPTDELGYIARGIARLPRDPQGAIADFDAALGLNPRSAVALQNKASVLSEYLRQPEAAIKALDEALGLQPERLDSLAGRAVLLARLGRREEALADATRAEKLNDSAAVLYQLAGVYALNSRTEPRDEAESIRLLAAAFGQDPNWIKIAATDPDLAPIRDHAAFRKLIEAVSGVASRPQR